MNQEVRTVRSVDVVVIGGGAAGLSGALMLARSRRSVVVVDAGAPRNAPAEGVHGLLGREGVSPTALVATGRDEVRGYGGEILAGTVVDVRREDGEFVVALADGPDLRARRVLVATGLLDVLPDVPGLAEQWGHGVLHCPYCHGYEVRDQAIGVLATGPTSVHHALLFRQLSDDLVYFTHGTTLDVEQETQFAARGIRVIRTPVAAAEAVDGHLTGLRLTDGRFVAREALAVATRMEAHAPFLANLGLDPVDHPSGMGFAFPADATGRTPVDGVWVAGNVTDLTAQVGAAAAAGALAGAHINADLVAEDTRRAVDADIVPVPFSAASEARLAERVAGGRRHGL